MVGGGASAVTGADGVNITGVAADAGTIGIVGGTIIPPDTAGATAGTGWPFAGAAAVGGSMVGGIIVGGAEASTAAPPVNPVDAPVFPAAAL